MSEIEVRIRLQSEAEGRHLCGWPATTLDRLIPTLRRWSVYTEENEAADSFFGQFRHDETGSYFEVVIEDEEDGS